MTIKDSLNCILPEEELNKIAEKIPPYETPLWKYWEEFIALSLDFWKSPITLQWVHGTMRFILRHSDLLSIESWQDTLKASKTLSNLRKDRGWSNVTLNSHRKCMNTYFLFLKRFKFIDENPIMAIIKMPEPTKNMPTLSLHDVKAILWHLMFRSNKSPIERYRNLLFIQIAVITWARPKELLSIKAESISSDRKKICINGAKQKWKERYYELNNQVQETLSLYLTEVTRLGRYNELSRSLFISMSNRGQWWTYRWVNKLCQRISEEMGKNVSMYMFRRHACTELFAKNVPIQNIQMFMWHNRLATTYRYNSNSTRNTKDCTDILGKW